MHIFNPKIQGLCWKYKVFCCGELSCYQDRFATAFIIDLLPSIPYTSPLNNARKADSHEPALLVRFGKKRGSQVSSVFRKDKKANHKFSGWRFRPG